MIANQAAPIIGLVLVVLAASLDRGECRIELGGEPSPRPVPGTAIDLPVKRIKGDETANVEAPIR